MYLTVYIYNYVGTRALKISEYIQKKEMCKTYYLRPRYIMFTW